MSVTVHHGDCLTVLRGMQAESFDAVVTDPPAGISFMQKTWDGDKGGRGAWIAWMSEVAAECLRVAKPGAHALVWALPRTSHWTATAWEDAGWQVRDRVAHLFGTGFPKSLDVGKAIDRAAGVGREVVGERVYAGGHVQRSNGTDLGRMNDDGWHGGAGRLATAPATPEAARWSGWGTALKPAVEDWWLLRKPLACPTVAAQVLATGTGALNIAATRVPVPDGDRQDYGLDGDEGSPTDAVYGERKRVGYERAAAGRWPPNICHDGSPEVLAAFAAFGERPGAVSNGSKTKIGLAGTKTFAIHERSQKPGRADTGSAARFFPALGFGEAELAKLAVEDPSPPAGRWPANIVHDGSPEVLAAFAAFGERGGSWGRSTRGSFDGSAIYGGGNGLGLQVTGQAIGYEKAPGNAARFFYSAKASKAERAGSKHPTVKPLALMRWLCRLVTPPGGTVLDPFAGSGTTGEAALLEGFRAVLIEREAEHVADIRRRLGRASGDDAPLFAESAA